MSETHQSHGSRSEQWLREIEGKARFRFGQNWSKYAQKISEEHIEQAVKGVQHSLGYTNLEGRTFLDVGGGSGIHSLAAYRLGAKVHSFDFDEDSVLCMEELRERFASPERWVIERGSALDEDYMRGLGKYDVVYSWGVLHHTGDQWRAIDLTAQRVKPNGQLLLALYNDQGGSSSRWKSIKRAYVHGSAAQRALLLAGAGAWFEGKHALSRLIRGKNPLPFEDWKRKVENRGMNVWTDLVDWVGGYPFEVSKPEEVFDFLRERGFRLEQLRTAGGGLGCNEYRFKLDQPNGSAHS